MLRTSLTACVLAAAGLACGCGWGPKTHPVGGRVQFKDGRPFTEGVVEFEPVGGGGRNASGRLHPDGTFRLTTGTPDDGAVAGEYRAVVVWSPPPAAVTGDRPAARPIHPRFADYQRSDLRFTVVPGPNEFVITVDKP